MQRSRAQCPHWRDCFDNVNRFSCCCCSRKVFIASGAARLSFSVLSVSLTWSAMIQGSGSLLTVHFITSVFWIVQVLYFLMLPCFLLSSAVAICEILDWIWIRQKILSQRNQRQQFCRPKICPKNSNFYCFFSPVMKGSCHQAHTHTQASSPCLPLHLSNILLATYHSPDSTAPAAADLCVQWTEDPLVPVPEPDLGLTHLIFLSHTIAAQPAIFCFCSRRTVRYSCFPNTSRFRSYSGRHTFTALLIAISSVCLLARLDYQPGKVPLRGPMLFVRKTNLVGNWITSLFGNMIHS